MQFFRIRAAEKRRATIDEVFTRLNTAEYIEQYEKFLTAISNYPDLEDLVDFESDEDEKYEAQQVVLNALNVLENIAAGVRVKAFDEKLLKRSQRGNWIADWNKTEHFIYELRETYGNPRLFAEFEWLARRWKTMPVETTFWDDLVDFARRFSNWFGRYILGCSRAKK